jgi:hypothetical protein
LVREIIHVVTGAAIAAVLLGTLIADRPVSVWRRREWFEFAAYRAVPVVPGGGLWRAVTVGVVAAVLIPGAVMQGSDRPDEKKRRRHRLAAARVQAALAQMFDQPERLARLLTESLFLPDIRGRARSLHHPTKDQADDHGRAEKTEIDLDVASGLGASPEVHGRGSRLSGVALRERNGHRPFRV